MQIDDLTLTLFSWENIPPTQYAAGSGNSSGNSTLGLLRTQKSQVRAYHDHAVSHDCDVSQETSHFYVYSTLI